MYVWTDGYVPNTEKVTLLFYLMDYILAEPMALCVTGWNTHGKKNILFY